MSRKLRDMWSKIKRHVDGRVHFSYTHWPDIFMGCTLGFMARAPWITDFQPNVRGLLCLARRNERAVNPIVPLNAVVTYAGSKLLTNSRLKIRCTWTEMRGSCGGKRSRILSNCEWICFRGLSTRALETGRDYWYIGNIILFMRISKKIFIIHNNTT